MNSIDPGAWIALAFAVLVVVLSVYAILYWKKRRKEMMELMPTLGFEELEHPRVSDLLPELLFHPNGFGSVETAETAETEESGETGETAKQGRSRRVDDLRSRVLVAWRGELAGRSAMVMDVSIDRYRPDSVKRSDRDHHQKINRTVLRVDPPGDVRPPDLLVEERVLFKSQVRDAVEVAGRRQLGEHYFVFSAASGEVLEPWVTPQLDEQLSRFRLWKIAAHGGTWFLTRSSSVQLPKRVPTFLQEGEALLTCLVRAS